jgi:hypothetical protein
MTTTVARIYQSYGAALEASNEIHSRGFRSDEIDVISKAVNTQDSQITDLTAEISRAGIPTDKVGAYAAAIDEGKSLLVVRAAWGSAKKALKIVGDHGPSEGDPLNDDFYVPTFTFASTEVSEDVSRFPFSAYFKIPLLLKDATPLSRSWGIPVLLPDTWTFSSFFSWPMLSNSFTFGAPKLVNSGTVFSDELRAPVLTKTEPEK